MLENMDKNLMLGIGGLLTLLVMAFIVPSVTETFSFTDISLSGVIVLLGAILSFIGFLGFLPRDINSFKNIRTNFLRLIYTALFIIISYLF